MINWRDAEVANATFQGATPRERSRRDVRRNPIPSRGLSPLQVYGEWFVWLSLNPYYTARYLNVMLYVMTSFSLVMVKVA